MKRYIFFLFSLFVLSCVLYQRIQWVAQFTILPTTDAYFYLQEFRSYIENGYSHYQTDSFFYRSVVLLAKGFSLDELQLYHVLVILSFLFLSLAHVLFFSRRYLWLVPAAIALPLLSDILFIRHYAFLRQSFSWSLLILCIALLCRIDTNRLSQKFSILVVALYSLSLHAFTVFSAGFLLISFLIQNRWLKLSSYILIAIAAYFFSVYYDKSLYSYAHLTFFPSWVWVGDYLQFSFYEYIEFATYTVAAIVLFTTSLVLKKADVLLFSLVLFGLILILPVWSAKGGMEMRLSFGFVWILVSALCIAVSTLEWKNIGIIVFTSVYAVIAVSSILAPRTSYPVESVAAPILPKYKRFLAEWIPQGSFVQAPQGVNFAVTYYLGLPSAKKAPQKDHYPARYRIERDKKDGRYESCYDLRNRNHEIPAHTSCVRFNDDWTIER